MTLTERIEKLAERGRFTNMALRQVEDGWQAEADDKNGRHHVIVAASPGAALTNLIARLAWATGGPIE